MRSINTADASAEERGGGGGARAACAPPPRAASTLYRVKKQLSPTTVTLADLASGEETRDLKQPVHVGRLRRFELADLSEEVEGPAPRLMLRRGASEMPARLLEQNAEGLVKLAVAEADGERMEWVDLTKEEYRWVDD